MPKQVFQDGAAAFCDQVRVDAALFEDGHQFPDVVVGHVETTNLYERKGARFDENHRVNDIGFGNMFRLKRDARVEETQFSESVPDAVNTGFETFHRKGRAGLDVEQVAQFLRCEGLLASVETNIAGSRFGRRIDVQPNRDKAAFCFKVCDRFDMGFKVAFPSERFREGPDDAIQSASRVAFAVVQVEVAR